MSDEAAPATNSYPGDAAARSDNVGNVAPATRAVAGRHHVWLLAVLGVLMGLGALSTDIYLPALPTMAAALRAGRGSMELTLSGYLAGFSLGQLLWGPIGDRYGRRRPIAAGLVLFTIGSIGCALAGDATTLVVWRVVQAVGACAAPVLARAMVRDLFARERAAQMLSTLMTIMALAPLVGPVIGGQVLLIGSWRAIFYVLVAVGVVALLGLATIPETLPPERRNVHGVAQAMANYGALLGDRRLLGYALAGALFYGGGFAYIAGTPFAYISYYHVSPQHYGALFALGVFGIMASNLVNTRAVPRLGSDRVLRLGTIGIALAGAWTALAGSTGLGGLWGLVVPLFLYMSGAGFIVANSVAGALHAHPERAGAASALVGAIHYGGGILTTALVGGLADGTPAPMGWIVGAGGVGSAVVTLFMLGGARSD